MGKRKPKVRWCIVDGLAWNNGNEEDVECGEGIGPGEILKGDSAVLTGGEQGGRSRPNRANPGTEGWGTSVAPRFERKAAAEQKHIYYEGEYCEAEELPNGFTKIRSKNLDILFKRDYYEQRLAIQRLSSDRAEKEAGETPEEAASEDNSEEVLEEEEESGVTPSAEGSMGSIEGIEPRPSLQPSKSFDQMDPSEIPEFKPVNPRLTDLEAGEAVSGHTSPFYGNYPYPATYSHDYGYNQGAPPRPNLYLYSPSNNTLIPCEEIVIPNPVMSPEGPVYSGPTNIYLAYPVQGPDGRGYITQPFNSYSPGSVSCDSSNYYSSTPHTPNSGQDSGSSTQPTSPPPLVNYHPNNWVRHHPSPPEEVSLPPVFQPKQNMRRPQENETGLGPHTTQYLPSVETNNSNSRGCNKPAPKGPEGSSSRCAPLNQHLASSSASGTNGPSTPAVTYIPGLPVDPSATAPKKSQKRRKKKKGENNDRTREMMEHRGSTSSESDQVGRFGHVAEAPPSLSPPSSEPEPIQHIEHGQVHELPLQEVQLTDSLADSLLNPPTDPEPEEEEPREQVRAPETETDDSTNQHKLCRGLQDSIPVNNHQEETNLPGDDVNMDVQKHQLEDDEVKEITGGLHRIAGGNQHQNTSQNSDEMFEQNQTANKDDNEIKVPVQTEDQNTKEVIADVHDNDSQAMVVDNVEVMVNTTEEKDQLESIVNAVHDNGEVPQKEIVSNATEAKTAQLEDANESLGSLPSTSMKGRYRGKNGRKGAASKKENKAGSALKSCNTINQVTKENQMEPPKMLYSSAMKTNLMPVAPSPPSPSPSVSKNSPQPTTVPSQGGRINQSHPNSITRTGEQENKRIREQDTTSGPVSKGDSWEKSVQSKKRKHKKSSHRESTAVHFEEALLQDQSGPVIDEVVTTGPQELIVKASQVESHGTIQDKENVEGGLEGSAMETSGEAKEEEEPEAVKKVRQRRKKKHGSEDPEESQGLGGHRVVICDDQVEIRFSRSVLRASDVLSPPQIDQVKSNGFCDFLIVSELGCGIQRGCMGLGRLYQGKYVPPERTDGLLPEEKRILEEQKQNESEENVEEEEEENKADMADIPATDIDLD